MCAGRSSKQTDLTVGLCVGWCLVTACHLSQSQSRTVPDPPIRAQISAASSQESRGLLLLVNVQNVDILHMINISVLASRNDVLRTKYKMEMCHKVM